MLRSNLYFLFLIISLPAMTSQENEERLDLPLAQWRLVTDGVMGGVSQGQAQLADHEGSACLHMTGEVSTRNNGGFLQVVHELGEADKAALSQFSGIRVRARGNGEEYNVHLRTDRLWFPWQAYRATFTAGPEWNTVRIPFSAFAPYKTSTQLDRRRISRVGVVAIGRDFSADVCIAEIGFYK